MFNKQQLAVVRFCAEECVRQHTGPEAVAWMVNAYQYAASTLQQLRAQGAQLEEEHILTLVTMIEPEVNCNGFRTTLVRFADGTVLNNQETIPSQIFSLLRVQDHATPEQFYQEYEEIHPCEWTRRGDTLQPAPGYPRQSGCTASLQERPYFLRVVIWRSAELNTLASTKN
jgi:hypothetical protein